MDKKSKILLTSLLIITVAFISYTSFKTLIEQDFEVVNIESIEEEGEGDESNTEEPIVENDDEAAEEAEVLDTEAAIDESAPQAE